LEEPLKLPAAARINPARPSAAQKERCGKSDPRDQVSLAAPRRPGADHFMPRPQAAAAIKGNP